MTTITPSPRRAGPALLLTGLAALAGCGGRPTLAPVSGVVRLDGKPYPNAVVSFQPLASKGSDTPGRGSMGVTDEQGRYVLRYDGVQPGAAVGRHRVRIMTKGAESVLTSETGSDDYTPPANVKADPIPPEWSGLSTKEFEVTAAGTDKADFAIESAKPGKKKK